MKIAIASGKGGTGKTTLAVNLALYLAEKLRVLLVDLDVEEPNDNIFLQGKVLEDKTVERMVPTWNKDACILCGKCINWCRFNAILKFGDKIELLPELCHSCYACSELCPTEALPMKERPIGTLRHQRINKLNFIESKLNIGVEQSVPLIDKTLEYAESKLLHSDLEIWDSPPGTSCSMIAAIKRADLVLLITEPTPFGLYDLNLAVETARKLSKLIAVVVNRHGIGNDDVYDYCEKREIPIWAQIPNLRQIAELCSQGRLIYQSVIEMQAALLKISERIELLRNRR